MSAPVDELSAIILEQVAMRESMDGVPPPKQPAKTQYTYRAPARLYEAVQAKAEGRGETVTDVIRRALEDYVDGQW